MKYLDINQDLFKRYRPDKKRDIIKLANAAYMLNLSEASIVKMAKEIGHGSRLYKRITLNKYISNNWNAVIEGVDCYKNKVTISGYVGGDSTEVYFSLPYNPVRLKKYITSSADDATRHGVISRAFVFSPDLFIEFLKELCFTYIDLKYGESTAD